MRSRLQLPAAHLAAAAFGLSALALLFTACHSTEPPKSPTSPTEPTTPPSTPPPNAQSAWRIAFVSTRDGSPQIYVATEDGSTIRRLTSGEHPAWSWDGQRIVLHRWSAESPSQIVTINVDGTNERVVGRGGFFASWSPDGTKIVYGTGVGAPDGGIHVMNADGSGVTRIVGDAFARSPYDDHVHGPTYSPDGKHIAFVRTNYEEPWQIYVVSPDGSSPHRVIDGNFIPTQDEPSWSPDGSMLAFQTYFGIATVNADGSDLRGRLSNAPYVEDPDWSPDGKSLVYNRFTGPPTTQWPVGTRMRVFVASLADGSTRQLIPEATSPANVDYWDYEAAWSRVNK